MRDFTCICCVAVLIGCADTQVEHDIAGDTAEMTVPPAGGPVTDTSHPDVLVYVSFHVISQPYPAEVYVIPVSDAQRNPAILEALNSASQYYRGLTGSAGISLEDLERSYHLIVRHALREDRRMMRLRRGKADTINVHFN